MAAIISVVLVVLVSMLINRFATIALVLTGMSAEEARFQARAAMSGVGLTTRSTDDIVSHPVRRRVVFWLMIVGSGGIVTAIASLVLSFRSGTTGSQLTRAGVLAAALLALWLLSRTRPVDRALSRTIAAFLRRRGYAARDWGTMLDLGGDYTIAELMLQDDDWLAGRRLRDLRLRDEGVTVIGVHHDGGAYEGAPGPETRLQAGERLILYGRAERIAELDHRQVGPPGDQAHDRACEAAPRPLRRTTRPAAPARRAR